MNIPSSFLFFCKSNNIDLKVYNCDFPRYITSFSQRKPTLTELKKEWGDSVEESVVPGFFSLSSSIKIGSSDL
jgi:hypothetical protein